MKTILKRLFICFLFVLIFSTCDERIIRNTIEISGTVTITRNGEPWIHDALIDTLKTETSARMQPPMPPYDRPAITAFTSPGGSFLGNNYDLRQPPLNKDDLALGTYTWTVELINVASVPKIIFFEVEVPMKGLSPKKMTHGIRIGEDLSEIDLGVINFDIVRLRGNLPVTVNGEPLTERNYAHMYIKNEDGSNFLDRPVGFNNEGKWTQDVYAPDSEVPVIFNLIANKDRAVFKKTLNPNHVITIHNTDKEIIFPDYPFVDFEAFSLSGTVEILVPDATRYWLEIYFYENDYEYDSRIGLAASQPPKVNEDGLMEWEALVPAFAFPKTFFLHISTPAYRIDSGILVTEDTDLHNIFLGSFP